MMLWYQDYRFIFKQFECGDKRVDETKFFFKTDPQETEHFIGFLPQYEEPYWAGVCDIPNGCSFKNAVELFEAKIYDGRSIKDRWDELIIVSIGGINVEDWSEFTDQYDIVEAHKHSSNHRLELEKDSLCGCFYCLKTFHPSEIIEWLDESNGDPRGTALCPFCGIDSVIGESAGFPITEEFLRRMEHYWFGQL